MQSIAGVLGTFDVIDYIGSGRSLPEWGLWLNLSQEHPLHVIVGRTNI